ncbi:MAG: T9SS type A sorting domain-containing protein [Chitinophagaceae bacterium]|nr:T9SS type A sorting domain-containing protein [Chitinophagaceae bacterium]
MNCRYKLLLLFLSLSKFTEAQYTFVQPDILPELNCHINVNALQEETYRNDIKRATFRFSSSAGQCTGTLINRNTGQNDLGQYFVTAWHCFRTGNSCGGNDINFNQELMTLTFNYQSPNQNNLVFAQNSSGNQYQIQRQVRLVDRIVCAYGDFALCEILGPPIPAHFNVYFAGWDPQGLGISSKVPFSGIHHPGGTIKKISGVSSFYGNVPPVVACQTVTTLIDFLFGWIWRRRWVTSVVCNFIQAPLTNKYQANFNYGKTERGSSGSGLFTGFMSNNQANRYMGTLSANFPFDHTCAFIDVGISHYGKFADNYKGQIIKNTLNPPNRFWIDQTGIPGRQINCQPQINLNAAESVNNIFNLFPANLYQQENLITLTSQTTTNTNGIIRVMPGANFTFQAGQSVNLNPGFEVQPGAVFNTSITPAPCFINNNAYRLSDSTAIKTSEYETPDITEILKNIPLPSYKKFDIQKAKQQINRPSLGNMKIFPNPTVNNISIEYRFDKTEEFTFIKIYDLTGREVYSKTVANTSVINEQISLSKLVPGLYHVSIRTKNKVISQKLIVAK